MKARVGYLAGLAGQAAGAAALRPPRQLFVASYSPPRSPGSGDSQRRPTPRHEQPMVPRAAARPNQGSERGERQDAGRADDAPSWPGIRPAAGTEAIQTALLGQDRPRSAQSLDRALAAPGTGRGWPTADGTWPGAANGNTADADPVRPGTWPGAANGNTADADPVRPGTWPGAANGNTADAGPGTWPDPAASGPVAGTDHGTREAMPSPGVRQPPADVPAQGFAFLDQGRTSPGAPRPPASWEDPLWLMPVEVPPATWRGAATDGKALAVPLRPTAAAEGAPPGGQPAVRDLLPPPGQATWPGAPRGQAPGARRQPSRETTRARLSIGTIEVTVAAPGSPARTQQVPPASPPPGGRSRRPSPAAGMSGADRLRDGLRRWYGTAQG
jgi:hypothetical protein